MYNLSFDFGTYESIPIQAKGNRILSDPNLMRCHGVVIIIPVKLVILGNIPDFSTAGQTQIVGKIHEIELTHLWCAWVFAFSSQIG